MQEKNPNMPQQKPGQDLPETGKQGGGQTDIGKKGGDVGHKPGKPGAGVDTGNPGEVGKPGRSA